MNENKQNIPENAEAPETRELCEEELGQVSGGLIRRRKILDGEISGEYQAIGIFGADNLQNKSGAESASGLLMPDANNARIR